MSILLRLAAVLVLFFVVSLIIFPRVEAAQTTDSIVSVTVSRPACSGTAGRLLIAYLIASGGQRNLRIGNSLWTGRDAVGIGRPGDYTVEQPFTPPAGTRDGDILTVTVWMARGVASPNVISSKTIAFVCSTGRIVNIPVANDDHVTTDEDLAVSINVAANDSDLDNNLNSASASLETTPANGAVVNNGNGSFTYTPNLNFNGTDSFTYKICDSTALCDTGTVSIAIRPVNDPPATRNDSLHGFEDLPATLNVAANDTDPEDNLNPASAIPISNPANGITFSNGDGTLTYVPNLNFDGTDTFDYQICDMANLCTSATVIVNLLPINDAPDANVDTANTLEDSSVNIQAAANDPDPEGNLNPASAAIISGPTNGGGVSNGDGSFLYIPNANFNGLDSFTYQICDSSSACDTGSAVVLVIPVSDPPIAPDTVVVTDEDKPVTVNLAAQVVDPDGNLDPASLTITTAPVSGSASSDGAGSVTYTPNPNFNGFDSFIYRICDMDKTCDTATVAVQINPVNDPPFANADNATTLQNAAVVIEVLTNDGDPDGDLLTIIEITQPANGSVVNNSNNVTFTPATGFVGTTTFTYTVSDGQGGKATATVTVVVSQPNRPPVAVSDDATTRRNTQITIDVLANDSDPDGDPLTITSVSKPPKGSVTNNGNNLIFTPEAGFAGSVTFNYTISDGRGGTATSTVEVKVRRRQDDD
jgi:hypothetical protein